MSSFRAFSLRKLVSIAPCYLPFADVATKDVPLSRLLRLSLFQVTVGMALVLLVGTLNRVMIVELAVPATLVAGMLAIPLLFAPLRAFIGFKSDTHRSALGWRRVPYIWKGTLYQFGGFAIMPFALLVLSGYAEAHDTPRIVGLSAAALAFLLVGAGIHIVQTVGLALATDLVKEDDHPKVVGLMYVMLLFGMFFSAQLANTSDAARFGRSLGTHVVARRCLFGLLRFGLWLRAHVQTCVDGFEVVRGCGIGIISFVGLGQSGGDASFGVVVGTEGHERNFAER